MPSRMKKTMGFGDNNAAYQLDEDLSSSACEILELPEVFKGSKKKYFSAKEVIYRESDSVDRVFMIISGMVKLLSYLPNGRARIIRLHGHNHWLGLEGLVGQPYEHTAVAVEDVAVTEAWLQINATSIIDGDSLVLLRNDSTVFRMSPVETDTMFYDNSLLPAHSYSYQAVLKRRGFDLAKSETVSSTTMDTTSHEFQWQSIEFSSPYGGGALYDVAIINEDDIWAVGEIYSDSAQPWLPYNTVHWNGENWIKELKLSFNMSCLPTSDSMAKAFYFAIVTLANNLFILFQ